MKISVYALPAQLDQSVLPQSTALVIDVLRATTTLTTALNNGATKIYPTLDADETRTLKANFPEGSVLLGGERKGVQIEGFDLDNSPRSYTESRVRGKTLLFTTTNGTVAMHAARQAKQVLLASFLNAAAIVDQVKGSDQLAIICAGTDGHATEEDLLLAGALVWRLVRDRPEDCNPLAQELRTRWEELFVSNGTENLVPDQLARQLEQSRGGRRLVTLELQADILAAAQIDSINLVPKLNLERMVIRRSDQ